MIFIAILKYSRPLDEVDALLPLHREFLKQLLDEGKLLLAGRQNPRIGGVMIVKNVSKEEFERILKKDPLSKVYDYQIVEVIPSFCDEALKGIIFD